MSVEAVTITIKIDGKRQDGLESSVTVAQELMSSEFAHLERSQIIDILQRFAANAYERAIREYYLY